MPFESLRTIAAKELEQFFASPIAYLFLGVYVFITLFIFFWVESFFSRNIADVRPMFEWMPILLILLSGALTMRMWSEERRSGTLEFIMTLPVSPWNFIGGKFIACLSLLIIALSLTLPIPITVSLFADVDWGPIMSGYIATIFLGSAYISIGLFVSARCENQIISLIGTLLLCGLLYLLGSELMIGFVSQTSAELLSALGSGSRFESITRGVLDLRDIYYYLSLVIVFLVLNRYTLEKMRWVKNKSNNHHRHWQLIIVLAVSNALFANLWLNKVSILRIDTTEGNIYSISDASRQYFQQLQEPLLIRGYFSEKMHPDFSPLVPQLKDLIKEYEYEGKGKILAEFIDPATNPYAEEIAGGTFGVYPQMFRMNDKYQSSVLNAYFNVLIKYGEQFRVINYQDLIEQKSDNNGHTEVRLRNPEYTLTNAIKAVIQEYQKGGNFFKSIQDPVHMELFISNEDKLPKKLRAFLPKLTEFLGSVKNKSYGRFSFEFIEPEANNGQVAKLLHDDYGFNPMMPTTFNGSPFYFYMILRTGDMGENIQLPEKLDIPTLNRYFDSALRHFAPGFTKTVGVVMPQQKDQHVPISTYNNLMQTLYENFNVANIDITSGQVSGAIDIVLLLSPHQLDNKSLFAIDQFLMKGGTVIISTSPTKVEFTPNGLNAINYPSGISQWLISQGITIDNKLVFDPQSVAFPMPVIRTLGEEELRETIMLDYPLFIDVRDNGLNDKNIVTSGLMSLTVPWSSPIIIDRDKNIGRHIEPLLQSSSASWLDEMSNLSPKIDENGPQAFTPKPHTDKQLLALALSGEFKSYYSKDTAPIIDIDNDQTAQKNTQPVSVFVEKSPASSRLIIVSSNSFADDESTQIMTSVSGNNNLAPFEFLTNAIEWSLADASLASIRSRAIFNRTLPAMHDSDRKFWEWLNYLLTLAGLGLIFIIRLWLTRRKKHLFLSLMAQEKILKSKADNAIEVN